MPLRLAGLALLAVTLTGALQVGIGKGSGASTELGYFQVWIFRDGKVIRLEVIRDRDAAFEAVGISS